MNHIEKRVITAVAANLSISTFFYLDGYEGKRTLNRRSGGSLWIWYHSRYLQGRLAVSINPLDPRNLTHLLRIQRSAIHQPRFQDFSRQERTCLGRPRTNAKQNFQKANPHTASTTVDICLSISSFLAIEVDLRWDNAKPHDESHWNSAFGDCCG